MYSLIRFTKLVPVVLACLAFLPQVQAAPAPYVFRAIPDVVPPPDGEYGGSTAEGYQALFSLTTGAFDSTPTRTPTSTPARALERWR
jgi:hypothetical protein